MYVWFVSSFIMLCIFSLVCRTQRYMYRLSVSTSLILPVQVGIPSDGLNFPLCASTFAQLLTQNIMPLSMIKMTTALTNAIISFYVFAYRLTSSINRKLLSFCPIFKVNPNVVSFMVQGKQHFWQMCT